MLALRCGRSHANYCGAGLEATNIIVVAAVDATMVTIASPSFSSLSTPVQMGVGDFRCCAMLCNAMLCSAMLYHAMLGYAMLSYAMPCYAMLCYALLCYAMLCSPRQI